MPEILFKIVEFFSQYFVQLLVAGTLFCFYERPRKFGWLSYILLSGLVIYLFHYLFISKNGFSFLVGSFYNFKFLIILFLYIFIIKASFQVSFWEAVFFSTASILIQNLSYDLILFITMNQEVKETLTNFLIYDLNTLLIYVFFFIFFVRGYEKSDKTIMDHRLLLSFSLLSVIVVNILNQWMVYSFVDYSSGAIYATLCCFLLLLVLYGGLKLKKADNEKALMEGMLSKAEVHYHQMEETIEAVNRKCHDIKRRIAASKILSDGDLKNQEIKSITDTINVYDRIVKTGNRIIDTLLSEKNLICENNDIRFSYILSGNELSFMNPIDLYAFLSNALDNAIEYLKTVEKEKRVMSLIVQNHEHHVVLRLDNYCETDVVLQDGLPITTKNDRNSHGYGTKNMVFIAKKYNGIVEFERIDTYFGVIATFPLK